MNPLSENITKGTFGELLVQLRLLQYGVQAAPPIKDSGNDLIAVRGEAFRAIQVKTRTEFPTRINLPELYHILAIAVLDPEGAGTELSLDRCRIFLFDRAEAENGLNDDGRYAISQERIEELFC
ncbi:MAG: hypothetical protein H8D78_12410 [Chloroflexi bacterium]|nr:hypothetical protein [Chloroflexota bacterium]